jgi:serine/threonine protein phosphatase 1
MASQTSTKHGVGMTNAPGSPRVPDDTRVYAIGDIHGRADLVHDMMQRIAHDRNAASPVRETIVVFVGDYVDRGPDSAGVLDQIARLSRDDSFTTCLLKGNHEVMFLDFLAEPSAFLHWAMNGGLSTLESYDIDVAALSQDNPERLRQMVLEAIPDAHLELLRNLKTSVVVGDYMFVHAGVRPGVPLDAQAEQDLIWIREPFLDFEGDLGKIVVHGHTPTNEPDIRSNRIDIDTLAWRSGTLTALVLENVSRRFLQT